MSRKHADLERELIEDLEPRTGRSRAQWMAAIAAAGLADKNAIIDWLRPQGLTFAHASWLERIHNNGGRPIYLDAGARDESAATAAPSPPPGPLPIPSALPAAPSAMAPRAPPARPEARPTATAAPAAGAVSLDSLLARGKGLRPLAEMLIREISTVLPGTIAVPAGELVSLAHPAELAALWIGPRELRLGLDLGDVPFEGPLARARLPGGGPRITHMVVVTDARQIAAPLLDLVRLADARSNP